MPITASYGSLRGPVFAGRPRFDDVVQSSQVGDCWLISALSAFAAARPDVLEEMVEQRPNGSVVIHFHSPDGDRVRIQLFGNRFVVDDKGEPLAARGRAIGSGEVLRWGPLIEQAYAQWHGGYHRLNGRKPHVSPTMAFTGREAEVFRWDDDAAAASQVGARLQKAVRERRPVVAGSNIGKRAALLAGSGIVQAHAYAVVGVRESRDGLVVKLRNPWAHGEPPGDGVDDGIFELKLVDFIRYFHNMIVS
jgi:hypothetical protein